MSDQRNAGVFSQTSISSKALRNVLRRLNQCTTVCFGIEFSQMNWRIPTFFHRHFASNRSRNHVFLTALNTTPNGALCTHFHKLLGSLATRSYSHRLGRFFQCKRIVRGVAPTGSVFEALTDSVGSSKRIVTRYSLSAARFSPYSWVFPSSNARLSE